MRDKIKELALSEINNPDSEWLSQYKNIIPKNGFTIDDIYSDFKFYGNRIIAFPILNKIFITLSFDETEKIIDVILVSGTKVRLVITSKTLTFKEIQELTGIKKAKGWSIGSRIGKRIMDFTHFELSESENLVEDPINKLGNLIELLTKDNIQLRENDEYNRYEISIVSWNFDSIQGLNIPNDYLKTIADYGLSLDIDYYLVTEKDNV